MLSLKHFYREAARELTGLDITGQAWSEIMPQLSPAPLAPVRRRGAALRVAAPLPTPAPERPARPQKSQARSVKAVSAPVKPRPAPAPMPEPHPLTGPARAGLTFTCLSGQLKKALLLVKPAVVNRSTTLPVLANVLVQSAGSRVKITATDLEITMSVYVGAQVESEFALTLPAGLLTDFVKSLPDARLEVDVQGAQATLRCEGAASTFTGTLAEEFPPIPAPKGASVEWPAQALRDAIGRVVIAAASDDSRPVLTGLCLTVSDDGCELAGADGCRLAAEPLGFTTRQGGWAERTIIPARTMSRLMAALGKSEERISFTRSETQGAFTWGNVEVVSQLIMGTFPDYPSLIPASKDAASHVTFDVEGLREAVKAATPFAREGSGIIRLMATSQGLRVHARAEELGTHDSTVPCQMKGQPGNIAFNSRFLADLLRVLPAGPATLHLNSPSNPGLFTSKALPDYRMVIMPWFVQWDEAGKSAATPEPAQVDTAAA